ncbi:MAG: hypothetical protein ACR2PP_05735 [Psychrobacter sp.]
MSELLAMLTPGAPPLSADQIRTTSGAKVTASEVAACMCHVDRHTYLYALSKFCLDDASRTELNTLAIADAQRRGYALNENEPSDAVERLALIALSFSISPSRCAKCKGTGQIKSGNKVNPCDRCGGTGNLLISVRRLAEALGVGRWRAQKVWLPRFQLLVSDYQVRDDALHNVIYRGLRDG